MLLKLIALVAVAAASVSAATAPVYAGCVDIAPFGATRKVGVITQANCNVRLLMSAQLSN